MPSENDGYGGRNLAASLLLAAAAATAVYLPNQVIIMIAGWIALSIPVGILVGHCVLSEE